MIFTEPVYIDEDNLLVPPGVAIKQKDLTRLTGWGIEMVQTAGGLAKTPETIAAAVAKQEHNVNNAPPPPPSSAVPAPEEDLNEFDAREIQENRGSYQEYTLLIKRLDLVFSHAITGIALDAFIINELTSQLLSVIRDKRSQFVGFILGGKVNGYELAKSSVNSAILAAMIAQELKLPPHKVMKIITGALLHDIGMLRLPKEILAKRGGLSQEEVKLMHTHPLHTYRIVSKELNYPDEVGFVALQHHERWDGQGYPAGISGENIDIGARILSVADAFEAMVSKKPYRNSMVGYEAMKALMSDNQSRFDPDVLKAFITIMGIYPIGSLVVLNDAAVARVTEILPGAPLRPKVQILIDKFGQKQQNGELLNLLTDKTHFISRALNPNELVNKHA
ncbi:MAG: HD-GYP domain-containing protein [Treponema sp.]|nr:HD-GYP domain-containing protein [Treponema sp.]